MLLTEEQKRKIRERANKNNRQSNDIDMETVGEFHHEDYVYLEDVIDAFAYFEERFVIKSEKSVITREVHSLDGWKQPLYI